MLYCIVKNGKIHIRKELEKLSWFWLLGYTLYAILNVVQYIISKETNVCEFTAVTLDCCNSCTVPGFNRLSFPLWSGDKDAYLLIRRSQDRAPPVTSIELDDTQLDYQQSSNSLNFNRNLCVKTKSITVGADATRYTYIWFLYQIYVSMPLNLLQL